MALRHPEVTTVGDKSPKSKQRDQKQKDAVKAKAQAKKAAANSGNQDAVKKK